MNKMQPIKNKHTIYCLSAITEIHNERNSTKYLLPIKTFAATVHVDDLVDFGYNSVH